MVKHTQIIRWLFSTNCLSVFDHFVGLTIEGLKTELFLMKCYLRLLYWYFSCLQMYVFKEVL